MGWAALLLLLCAPAAAQQVEGSVLTCAGGHTRLVRGVEVRLFDGEAARQVREQITAVEHVLDSEPDYRVAYQRLRETARRQPARRTKTDRQGGFRFRPPGSLVLVMRKGRFDFAFLNGGPVELWLGDVAREQCRR